MDEEDVYGDLDHFDLGDTISQFEENNKALTINLENSEKRLNILAGEISELKKLKRNLEVNISMLFKTAKAEIERKNRQITELRKEVDNAIFKRGGKAITSSTDKETLEKDDMLMQQLKCARHEVEQKNRIILSLNKELEHIKAQNNERFIKRKAMHVDDEIDDVKYKKQKFSTDRPIENYVEYKKLQDKPKYVLKEFEDGKNKSRSRSPDRRRFSDFRTKSSPWRGKFRPGRSNSKFGSRFDSREQHRDKYNNRYKFNKDRFENYRSSNSHSKSPSTDDSKYDNFRNDTCDLSKRSNTPEWLVKPEKSSNINSTHSESSSKPQLGPRTPPYDRNNPPWQDSCYKQSKNDKSSRLISHITIMPKLSVEQKLPVRDSTIIEAVPSNLKTVIITDASTEKNIIDDFATVHKKDAPILEVIKKDVCIKSEELEDGELDNSILGETAFKNEPTKIENIVKLENNHCINKKMSLPKEDIRNIVSVSDILDEPADITIVKQPIKCEVKIEKVKQENELVSAEVSSSTEGSGNDPSLVNQSLPGSVNPVLSEPTVPNIQTLSTTNSKDTPAVARKKVTGRRRRCVISIT